MAENDPPLDSSKDPRRLPSSERPRIWPRYSQDQLTCRADEQGRKFYFLPTGRPVCGRLRKGGNRVIENEACMGQSMASGPCRVHGGASPGGQMTKDGRYSRALKAWKPAFERALEDEALLDTRRDLALMDAGIEQLLARVEEADCPSWRAEVQAVYRELDAAVRSGKQRQVGPLLKQLGEKIAEGAKVDAAVNDLMRHVDRRAERAHKINELEVRRDEKLTVREVGTLFARVIEILRERLDAQQFVLVVPHLKRLTEESRLPALGSIEERDRHEAAGETLQELAEAGTEIEAEPAEGD